MSDCDFRNICFYAKVNTADYKYQIDLWFRKVKKRTGFHPLRGSLFSHFTSCLEPALTYSMAIVSATPTFLFLVYDLIRYKEFKRELKNEILWHQKAYNNYV